MYRRSGSLGNGVLRRAALPVMESLEERQLLSATLHHGNLVVRGTQGDDTILIAPARNSPRFEVTINGKRSSFARAGVRKLTVLGGRGDDIITIAKRGLRKMPAIKAYGGPGENKLLGLAAPKTHGTGGTQNPPSTDSGDPPVDEGGTTDPGGQSTNPPADDGQDDSNTGTEGTDTGTDEPGTDTTGDAGDTGDGSGPTDPGDQSDPNGGGAGQSDEGDGGTDSGTGLSTDPGTIQFPDVGDDGSQAGGGLLNEGGGTSPVQMTTEIVGGAINGVSGMLKAQGGTWDGTVPAVYNWAVTDGPAGVASPVFASNGGGSRMVFVSFWGAGSYTFSLTAVDGNNNMLGSGVVTVLVAQVVASIQMLPPSVSLAACDTQQFAVVALDQFGTTMANPAVTWSVDAGGVGAVDGVGLYSAGTAGGAAVVRAAVGAVSGAAQVAVASPIPVDLSATGDVRSIRLSWSSTTSNGAFVIQRSTDATNFSEIARPQTSGYLDAGLLPNTTYWYRVCSVLGAVTSGWVGPVSATAQTQTAFYVATTGSDSASGTINSPFRTIQKAADNAQPGDTVYIRGGIYRETVTPAESGTTDKPILFKAYNGEKVTVSGADVVEGWSLNSGAIYKAGMPWSMGLGNDQVFVDGQMMIEARWPNTTLDVSHPILAHADSGADGMITDANMTQPIGFWNGATIRILSGQGWVSWSGTITSQTAGLLFFTSSIPVANGPDSSTRPRQGNAYYLTGRFEALDAADEWFRDPATGMLYLWTPGSDAPASHVVEAKRRLYAFDLRGRSHVTVQGIDVFAATIITDNNTSYTTLDSINGSYLSHFSAIDNGWGWKGTSIAGQIDASGIILAGHDNQLINSTLAYSAGNGISLLGSNNTVSNNVIHDIDYSATDAAGISTGHTLSDGSPDVPTTGDTISYNTVYNAGRSLIVARNLQAGKIVHNELFLGGLQTTDLGGIYTYKSDGGGTEIAYNRIHDLIVDGNGAAGIYLDGESSNFVVHHNIVWNTRYALMLAHSKALHPAPLNNLVYNNTLLAETKSIAGSDLSGNRVFNNIFNRAVDPAPGDPQAFANNLDQSVDPQFMAPSRHDYRLRGASPAIDAGQVVASRTDAYAGLAPDLGAMESGNATWTAGAAAAAGSPVPGAFFRLDAISYDAMNGVQTLGTSVTNMDNRDWVRYSGMDFGTGARTFTAWIAVPAAFAGGQIELRMDGPDGALIGTLTVGDTGGWGTYAPQTTSIQGAAGVHDLYLVGRGGSGIGNIQWIQFGR